MARRVEAFFEHFLTPLAAGGELRVRRPYDEEDLQQLRASTVIEELIAPVEHARQRRAADIWISHVPTPLDEVSLRLAVGLHNLLFLCHPSTGRWWVRSSSIEEVEAFTFRCLDQAPPVTPSELVSRHTLLWSIPHLSRTDTEVRYWAGRRVFRGMSPPRRLLRWRSLRNVEEVEQEVDWLSTISHRTRALELLVRCSPLTDLLSPERSAPPFDWFTVAPALHAAEICRLVCHDYLDKGLARVGPPLSRAFWRLVGEEARPGRRRALLKAVGLVLFLYASVALVKELDDELLLDPEQPTESMSSILMSAASCGLLPRLHNPLAETRLRRWSRIPRNQLGEGAGELALGLEVALAG